MASLAHRSTQLTGQQLVALPQHHSTAPTMNPTTRPMTGPMTQRSTDTIPPRGIPSHERLESHYSSVGVGFENHCHTQRTTTTYSHYFPTPSHTPTPARTQFSPTRTRLSVVPPPTVSSHTAHQTPNSISRICFPTGTYPSTVVAKRSPNRQHTLFRRPVSRSRHSFTTPISKHRITFPSPSTNSQHNSISRPPSAVFTFQHGTALALPHSGSNSSPHATTSFRRQLPQLQYGSSSSPSTLKRLDTFGNARSIRSREQMPPPVMQMAPSLSPITSSPVFGTPRDRSGISPGQPRKAPVDLRGLASIRASSLSGRRVARR